MGDIFLFGNPSYIRAEHFIVLEIRTVLIRRAVANKRLYWGVAWGHMLPHMGNKRDMETLL
jgi:hypothetical protein